MRRLHIVLFICIISLQAAAQTAPPSTDIYLVEIRQDQIVVDSEGPLNLTNRDGYDNQPFFSPDGRYLLYTSQRGEQTDIYTVSFPDLHIENLTNTPESEYSPTRMPDGTGFSVIRVESDGTQRLWRFDMNGENPALLFPDIKPVGYHAWIDNQKVAMFILGEPPTLQIGTLPEGEVSKAAASIGRSLHRIPNSKLISFVRKGSDPNWRIRQLDSSTGTMKDIAPTLPGREDYAWTPDGSLIMANGATLFRWNRDQGKWVSWYDFSFHGITNISRLAVSGKGNKLAFVADR